MRIFYYESKQKNYEMQDQIIGYLIGLVKMISMSIDCSFFQNMYLMWVKPDETGWNKKLWGSPISLHM